MTQINIDNEYNIFPMLYVTYEGEFEASKEQEYIWQLSKYGWIEANEALHRETRFEGAIELNIKTEMVSLVELAKKYDRSLTGNVFFICDGDKYGIKVGIDENELIYYDILYNETKAIMPKVKKVKKVLKSKVIKKYEDLECDNDKSCGVQFRGETYYAYKDHTKNARNGYYISNIKRNVGDVKVSVKLGDLPSNSKGFVIYIFTKKEWKNLGSFRYASGPFNNTDAKAYATEKGWKIGDTHFFVRLPVYKCN